MHPEHHKFSKEDESNVCFLAFPDSHSNATGDSVFSFRFPRARGSAGAVSESVEGVHVNGFVFNRVQRDKALKRGYLQKSVVVLTERSDVLLWPLFRHMVGVIGLEYFKCVPNLSSDETSEAGAAFLHAVFREVFAWPSPVAGVTHELPLMGSVVRYHVAMNEFLGCGYDAAVSSVFYPPAASAPASAASASASMLAFASGAHAELLSALDELSVFRSLYVLLPDLWTLWELLLVGEPLLVFCQTPGQSSSVVASLVSLVLPLRYGGQWRPYFTIHDSDFRHFTQASAYANGNCIVGVTNPFFLREFKDWPNKLTLAPDSLVADALFSAAPEDSNIKRQRSVSSTGVTHGAKLGSGISNGHDTPAQSDTTGVVDALRRRVMTLSRQNMHAGVSVLETPYRPAMRSSAKALMDELIPLKGTKGHAGEANWRDINGAIARSNNRTIRRHFFERTQQFLIPLESFFMTLMPVLSPAAADGNAAELRIKPFDKNDFLRRVKQKCSKELVELYRYTCCAFMHACGCCSFVFASVSASMGRT